MANVNGFWTARTVGSTDARYNQRLTLRVDQRGTALSGQYESVSLCCPESSHKRKLAGSVTPAGAITLRVNAPGRRGARPGAT